MSQRRVGADAHDHAERHVAACRPTRSSSPAVPRSTGRAPDQNPGVWEDKPLVACDQSVQGIAGDDGTLTFALAPLCQACTSLDIVLVPGTSRRRRAGPHPRRSGRRSRLSFDADVGRQAGDERRSSSFSGDSSFVPRASSSSFAAATVVAELLGAGCVLHAPGGAVAAAGARAAGAGADGAAADRRSPAAVAAEARPDGAGRGLPRAARRPRLRRARLRHAGPRRRRHRRPRSVPPRRRRRPRSPTPVEPVSGGLGRFARPRTGPPPALS